jgi:hypothetical protein
MWANAVIFERKNLHKLNNGPLCENSTNPVTLAAHLRPVAFVQAGLAGQIDEVVGRRTFPVLGQDVVARLHRLRLRRKVGGLGLVSRTVSEKSFFGPEVPKSGGKKSQENIKPKWYLPIRNFGQKFLPKDSEA